MIFVKIKFLLNREDKKKTGKVERISLIRLYIYIYNVSL